MDNRRLASPVALAVLVLMTLAGLPTMADWTYTSANPLVWEFNDISYDYFDNPVGAGASQAGWVNWNYYVFQSNYPTVKFNYCQTTGVGSPPTTIWRHTASTGTWGTGSLLIQTQGEHNGASFGYCRQYADPTNPVGDCDFATNTPGQELNWGRGVVVETRAKTVGGLGTEPEGYTWGVHSGHGGILLNMRNLTDIPPGGPAGYERVAMSLCWNTNDPTTPSDDRISIRQIGGALDNEVAVNLGGDPENPPIHVYKFAVRRSPLPLVPSNRVCLINAWVDDTQVYKNFTTYTGPATSYDFVGLGTRGEGYPLPFGNEYDYLKIYEGEPLSNDTTPPTPPTNLQVVVNGLAATLTWDASTDPVNDVIGYRLYRDDTYVDYTNWNSRSFVFTGLKSNTNYTFKVVAVDEVGNASTAATIQASTGDVHWTYTQSNPLVFDFDDNGTSEFINPSLTAGTTYITHANPPFSNIVIGHQRTHDSAGNLLTSPIWKHTFNDAGTGTLTIQSNPDHTGMSWTGCVGGDVDSTGYTNPFTGTDWTAPLDMGRGVELSARVKSVGGAGTAPPGYNWGYSTDPGGMCFQFGNLGVSPDQSPSGSTDACLELTWLINDPTNPTADQLRVWSAAGIHAQVNFPLRSSADPNNAPTNEYKIVARRSPLPLQQRNDTLLVTVYVNGTPVPGLTNRTFLTNRWEASDWILLGTNGIGSSQIVNARGDQFDWVKVCEAAPLPPDTDNPTAPTNVKAVLTGSVQAKVTWSASTDPTTGVIGYRIYRNGDYVGWVEGSTTSYQDNALAKNSTNTYTIQAVDAVGNTAMSAPSNAVVTSPPTLTWEFDDNGNTTYRAPQVFRTFPKQTSNYWFGDPDDPAYNDSDGYVRWTYNSLHPGVNDYEVRFSTANGGSMTIQSNTPPPGDETYGAVWIRSNDLTNAFQWVYHPNYPTAGETFVRGPLVECDFDLVGDKNGWCAAWDTFPAIGGCAYTTDLYHAASDWGGMSNIVERQLLEIVVGPNKDMSIPGHEGYGNTGNGAQYIIGVHPNALRDSTDDEIRVYSIAAGYAGIWRLRINDGVGLGLTVEDGSPGSAIDPVTGLTAPRDGVIQGNGSHLKMEVSVLPAGGNDEYWDIWITRPNGTKIHIDPSTCTATTAPASGGFGTDGHTFKVDTAPTTTGYNYTQLMLSQSRNDQEAGYRINSVMLYSDYGTAEPPSAEDVADIRLLRDPSMVGKLVKLTGKACTNVFGNQWYWIEEEDRYSAIGVQPAAGAGVPTVGQRVTVTGTVSTVDGATVLTGATFTVNSTGTPLKTLGMTVRSLGLLPNADGLFVRVAGRVTLHPTRTDAFYINDGGDDLLVVLPAGVARPADGSMKIVDGNLLKSTTPALMVSSANAMYNP